MTTAAGPEGAVPLDVQNASKIGPYLWVGFYTTILTFITLTLYRFWARTLVRKRLWADTTIGGEPLEYTGRGLELLIGAVIALFTVMLPLFGAIYAAQLLLDPLPALGVITAVYLLVFLLVGVAIFLARRYLLSRTTWRGVRFEQRGSALAYGLAAYGYGILTMLTLGWFGPAARLRLEKRLWSSTYFGDMPFSYDNSPPARTEPVYTSYVLAYVGFIAFYAAVIAGAWLLFRDGGVPDLAVVARLYAIVLAAAFALVFFIAWHEAAVLRQVTRSISLEGVSLRSRFSAWDLIQLAVTNALLIVFTLGFGAVAAQMRVWRKVCRRLEVEGALDPARISQAASRGPKSGEGMADAFDLTGGV